MTPSQIEKMLANLELDLTGEKEDAALRTRERAQEMIKTPNLDLTSTLKVPLRNYEHIKRSPAVISKEIKRNIDQLNYLYKKRMRGGTGFEGRIIVKIIIMPNGKVRSTEVISSTTGFRV